MQQEMSSPVRNKILTLHDALASDRSPIAVSHDRKKQVIVEKVSLGDLRKGRPAVAEVSTSADQAQVRRTRLAIEKARPAVAEASTSADQAPIRSKEGKHEKKKSRFQRRKEAQLTAKRERTRKAIEKRRKARKDGLPLRERPGRNEVQERQDAREGNLKDRVAHLARMIVQNRALDLHDVQKAKSQRDWLMNVRTKE